MNKADFRIVFMGTPAFAVPTLQTLYEAGYTIAGVVTSPDKPAGRGLQLQESAVKVYAKHAGIPILQPLKLKEPAFLEELKALRADIQVVVAFRMLPEVVWKMPRLGTVNLHASLLPAYRGAAPINHVLIQGEKQTGVTTFFLQHQIDTGDLIDQTVVDIEPAETAGTLHDKLMQTGATLMLQTIDKIAAGTVTTRPQPAGDFPIAPKIFREHGCIAWNKPVQEVHQLVRGLSPYPGAWTLFQDKTLKIYEATALKAPVTVAPGTIDTDQKTYLRFACADGWLEVKELQLEGKKRLPVDAFLRGLR